MVVLLRLIKCLFTSAFKRRIDPLGEGLVTMRVWPNDLDLNFHANSGRFVSFMDIGRVDLVVRFGVMRKVLARKWRPLVGGSMLTYRKSLLPFEKFIVRSRVVCWDEKWFYFEHVIEKSGGVVAATATVRGLIRGPKGNVPPQAMVDLAGHDQLRSPEMPASIARWLEAEKR